LVEKERSSALVASFLFIAERYAERPLSLNSNIGWYSYLALLIPSVYFSFPMIFDFVSLAVSFNWRAPKYTLFRALARTSYWAKTLLNGETLFAVSFN